MRHFLNNIEISPVNVLEIGVNTSFIGNPSLLELDVDKLILPREGKEIVEQHIAQQGVFEGIPYRVEMDGNVSLEYYVDLTDDVKFRDFEIEVKIKRRLGKDQFFDNADGTSFELMAFNGVQFQFIDIPYLIIQEGQFMAGLSLGISLYVMTKEAIEATQALATSVQNLIEAVVPSIGTGVVINTGEIITLALSVLANLAYVATLYYAIIKLAQQLFELLFPKIRYYKGATVKELIKKGCQYLGYNLNSTLLNSMSQLTIMPVPLVKEKKSVWDYIENDLNFSFTKGYPSAQDTTPTLGDLIRAVETMFNAKTKVLNGVVQIERRDYWQDITTNQILPALNMQDRRQSEYYLNTDEAWKRTYIHYQVDYSDSHTLDNFDPTDAEYSTEPLNVINQDLITIKGLNDVNIPFALGVRKNTLNWLEKLAKGLFEFIDGLTGIFGGGTNYASIIQNRIGVTQISSQFYSTSKLLYAVNGKQPANYMSIIRASVIYKKYHKINEIQINGYKIYDECPVAITSQEFVNLLDNNYADIDGVICEILKIRYIDEQSKALISYRIPNNYASGKVYVVAMNE